MARSGTIAVPLHLADAPAIDSLRFRRPTGSDDDYEAMARVMDAANTQDGVPWIPRPRTSARRWMGHRASTP